MAYRRSRRSYSSSSGYGRRRPTSRRRVARRRSVRAAPQRVVIQVISGPGGMVPISATTGKKGKRTLRSRH